ncbi:MAG: ABC transporter ATP-binding protein [Thermodesulfobacteriota bacterium]
MIQAQDLHKSFNGQPVLRGIELEIRDGEMLALIGRSGAGKSVLLRQLMGLARPDRGRVLIDGVDVHRSPSPQRKALKERFGVLFQGGALFDSMTVFDNVAFPLRERYRLEEKEIAERVLQELALVDLMGAQDKYPAEISGGMRKRVALARAIIHNPKIVFFDEPTTGLDPITARSIHQLIHSTHSRLRFTGIIVTHETWGLFSIVDRVALLHEGRIAALGTPEELMESREPVVREFLEAHRGLRRTATQEGP